MMRFMWILLGSLVIWPELMPAMLQCQLQPGGECVCGDPSVHGYCSRSQCAPDDFNTTCISNGMVSDDRVTLFDSNAYLNLLEGPNSVWVSRDIDDDQIEWHQQGDGCHNMLLACSVGTGVNNWIFSQHIKYPPGSITISDTEIYVNITYTIFHGSATVYKYDTGGIVSMSDRQDTSNYNPMFGRYGSQLGTSATLLVRSFVTTGKKGFYIGIKDGGTCGQIRGIVIYYTPCKKRQDGLVDYPELVRPPNSSLPNEGMACCAPNSHPTTSLTFRAHSATDGTTGDEGCERNVRCECDAGYRLNAAGTECEVCPAGTYRSLLDPPRVCITCPTNTLSNVVGASICRCLAGHSRRAPQLNCQPCPVGTYRSESDSQETQCISCPSNTVRSAVAASVCLCLGGFFRDITKPISQSCTSPPGPVRNLRTTTITSTSVSLSWTRPEVTGRDDFYYSILYIDPNTGSFIFSNGNYVNSTLTVSYTVPNLRPNTPYTIRVTTHNGVSDQDTENEALRIAYLFIKTIEGAPSVPRDVQVFSGVVVWGPPAEPNGVITGYQLRFSGISSRTTVNKLPSDSYHVVTEDNIRNLGTDNIQVSVRARTSADSGPYSSLTQYTENVCPESPTYPSSMPPTTCLSATPCPKVACPPTPTPRDCPTVTCSPTPTPKDCPTVTCPPTPPRDSSTVTPSLNCTAQCPLLLAACVKLEPLVNGVIDYGGRNDPFSLGTVATYFCNSGYALTDGPDSKTCVESDEGTGAFDPPQTPTCDPECDQIFVPPNAMVTYNTAPVPPFPVGALAMFECVEGFSPGTTSPGEPTTFPLPGELILLECGEIIQGGGGVFVRNGTSSQVELNCTRDCVELPAITSGMISYTPDMTANYSAGTVATYTCDDGFELVPGVGNSMRTCLPVEQMPGADPRSEFDGAEPRCEPVCRELVAIPNGMISYSPDMTAPYSVDTVATYTCNDGGFRFMAGVGDQMRTCTEVVESESTVVSGAEFSGMAPSCEPVPTGTTTCTITDPMLVSPFTRSTSYTFTGTCEHALLQSCDDSVDFMVHTDFLTDSMDNGAVGVFIDGASFIGREDGSFESSETSSLISGVPGRETTVYADSNVEVERRANYTEIRVGGGIGVNIRHNYGNPSSIIVTVVTGSSLGETCGLCGTQSGDLRRSDGTIADITDRAQVEAFTMDYLTPADQQALRPIRRECSAIRNDTVIGDLLYSVALTKINGGPDNLCYEVRGSDNQNYNLISDECVSVNALYQAMDIPEFGNIMGTIGVRAATNDERCYNIRVEREGCRALASDGVAEPTVIKSTFATGGISVRRYPNRVRISAPNCDQVTLVMWVRCVTREGQDMLDFVVSRRANLRPTSHGLLGQFWNIPVSSSPISGSFYTVTVNPDDSPARSFTAEVLPHTWDDRRELCLYGGDSQGDAYNELQNSSFPADSVIQGRFSEYQTTGLYTTSWRYSQFRCSVCSAGDN